MRKQPTEAEGQLWARLRNRQVAGAKFRRQHPVDHFIVDFYCAEASLAIEVDGAIHGQTREADSRRQACIEGLGLKFLRFTNDDVLNHMDQVVATIAETVTNSRPLK